jgi:hypothetical protein
MCMIGGMIGGMIRGMTMRWIGLATALVLAACHGGGDAEGGSETGSTGASAATGGPSTSMTSDADTSTGAAMSTSVDGSSETGGTTIDDTVEDHGVTWTFSQPVTTGRFITGDPWVLCPATVIAIDPAPAAGRNGSVLNLPPTDVGSGWDDRVAEGRYDATLRSDPPIDLVAGDRLLSSISVETPGLVENWLREGEGELSDSPVWSISVLTCLDAPAPDDAFRPAFGEPVGVLRRFSELDLARLPALAPPSAVDDALLGELAARMSRPWIDNLFFGFDAQVEYMPMYGREVGRATGMASMIVLLDLPGPQKEAQTRVLIGLVQRGIDLWGLVRAGHPGWPAFGGHGSGRKWPIVFAGLLFGDMEMGAPDVAYPEVRFGEDMHTAHVADVPAPANVPTWFDQSTVVYTGHQGLWQGAAVSDDPAWGPYEHLPPEQWLDAIGESYRRCCTSIAWVGQALAARLLGAQGTWGHDAFFDYVDRWMDPTGDAEYVAEILARTDTDYSGDWAAHGQAWDPIVGEMWAAYR